MEEVPGPSSPSAQAAVRGDEQQAKRSPTSGKRRHSPEASSSSTGSRRPRRSDPEAASRGRRMFGLLASTLNKANEDNARRTSGEAGRKRAELEARLQEKQRAQSDKIRLETELGDDLRRKLRQAYDLALEIESKEDAIRLRKAQKRRMASFLVTTSELCAYDGRESRTTSVDKRTLATEVPLVLAPVTLSHPERFRRPDLHPVYFLPKTMLPRQDDTLDEQEDHVDAEIDEADDEWAKAKAEMEDRLASLQQSISKIKMRIEEADGDSRKGAQSNEVASERGDIELAKDDSIGEGKNGSAPVKDDTDVAPATEQAIDGDTKMEMVPSV